MANARRERVAMAISSGVLLSLLLLSLLLRSVVVKEEREREYVFINKAQKLSCNNNKE